MKKLSMIIALVFLGSLMTSADMSLYKYIDSSDGRIKIDVQVSERIINVTVIDGIPFCFSAEDISHNGKLKKTREGISFIEWSLDIEGKITLSYLPKRVMQCATELSLSPPRVFMDGKTTFGNKVNLTQEDISRVKDDICNLDGFCGYPNENYFNCPSDCPSGSKDGICDGVKDNICDPDCVRLGIKDKDPDCKVICNKNRICEPHRGENHGSCPEDCLSGFEDGYCDGVEEGICDPDCKPEEDPDCRVGTTTIPVTTTITLRCGNSICEEFESYGNCPQDCSSGGKDNYCDGVGDGICDPDCSEEEDPDCGKEGFDYTPYVIGIIAAIFIILLANSITRRRKLRDKGGEDEKITEWVESQLREGEDPNILKKALSGEGVDTKIVDDIMKRL